MFSVNQFTFKNIIFLILVFVSLKFLVHIKAIALLFFASYVIACSLNPIVDYFEKKMNRSSAATFVLMIVLAVSVAFFVPVVFVAFKQINSLVLILPQKLDAVQAFLIHQRFFGHSLLEMINFNTLLSSSSQVTSGIVNQSINITIGAFQGVMYFLAICMIVFYLLVDKSVIQKGFIMIFPQKMRDKVESISATISNKVGGYVIAQILNMIVIGILTTVGLLLLNVDYSLLLGLITGVLDIIPVVGPTVALVLCLVMAYNKGIIGLVLVLFVFLLAQWISNNLVRPVVFGKFLDLHPLVIIFSLLVAAQFLGVWGVILAPAIAAMVCVLFEELYIKAIDSNQDE